MNDMANLADSLDVGLLERIRQGMGADKRLRIYLYPGCGFWWVEAFPVM